MARVSARGTMPDIGRVESRPIEEERRPWGSFHTLEAGPKYKVKRLVILPVREPFGVAELPALLVESFDLQRDVYPCNLRRSEVVSLNWTCHELPVRFHDNDAAQVKGRFDHLWIVSVLNDPERFPHVAPLSYGRADPVTFNPTLFQKERKIVQSIVDRCMPKLSLPGLVTTSTEEVIWIADWCHRKKIPYLVEHRHYPTALVGDPVCFIKIGKKRSRQI